MPTASLTNSKKNQDISVTVSANNKNKYSLKASHQYSSMGKQVKSVSLKNELKINTPSKELISLQNYVDFRQGKSLKIDSTLAVDQLLNKPANIRGKFEFYFN